MQVKRIIAIAFIVVFGAFLIFSRRSKYNEYHNAGIDGAIESFSRYRGYVMIYVNGEEFRIIPVTGPLNWNTRFDDIAETGDRLYKKAGNDTLSLSHKGKLFKYTVGRW